MQTSPDDLASRYALAQRIAWEAGRLTLDYFQQGVGFERKADDSPVTVADRAAEELLRERIEAAFPQDAILGEEFGERDGQSGYRWILDPIDGTKSFITGVPLYGTMVAVERDGEALIGVVYCPGLDEGVYACRGEGAWHVRGDGQPLAARVSDVDKLSDGVFLVSQVDSFAEYGRGPAFDQLQQAAYVTRTWGDCYGYLLVATGRAVAMVDPAMSIWDAAALAPIMIEAGGTFTNWQGEVTIHSEEGIGTNGTVLDEVLAITRQYQKKKTS